MSSPNILLLVLDAVRPDHCSCYGYERTTTPNIDTVAAEGVQYTNAFSNSNWTAGAHGALFTGQPPSISGVYGKYQILPDSIPTLPELVQDAGYRTIGTSAGAHIREKRGYNRGFNQFLSTVELGRTAKIVPEVVGDTRASIEHYAIELIRGGDSSTHFKARTLSQAFQKTNDPIFAFANFKTAHSPYKNAPEPYKSYFTDDSIRSANPLLDIAYREFLDRTPEKIDGLEYERLSQLANDFPLLTNQFEPTNQEWQVILDWYDGAIRYMDQKVGLILDELTKANELNNTWIIVTADHGELFGEHGLESHIFSLYDTLLRVPLIIRPPSGEHNTVSEMCSWIDLYPTICEIAGADYPDRNHAKSLLPVGSNPDHDHLYAEVSRKYPPKVKDNHPDFESIKQNGPLQSVRNELWKLIQFHSGDVELYNWADDPSEMTDCSDSHPTVVKKLQKQLDTELGDMDLSSHHETTVTSTNVRDKLEHLGYL